MAQEITPPAPGTILELHSLFLDGEQIEVEPSSSLPKLTYMASQIQIELNPSHRAITHLVKTFSAVVIHNGAALELRSENCVSRSLRSGSRQLEAIVFTEVYAQPTSIETTLYPSGQIWQSTKTETKRREVVSVEGEHIRFIDETGTEKEIKLSSWEDWLNRHRAVEKVLVEG